MGEIRRMGMEDFQANMKKVCDQVKSSNESVLLTRHGRAVVWLVSLETMARLAELEGKQ